MSRSHVSTVKKSTARAPADCACRNCTNPAAARRRPEPVRPRYPEQLQRLIDR